ncbi:lytic polysaccharide monooxygenase [Streptomyces sp. HNM0575]|uniref:lytic polysaccharide monooxygenase auxiliary activity family 9 protein n=1 Tax=Streptomyces sp. HNM0575 TaxID=2716338 RepID=UPI00145E85B6|nr:lytic polysaccharide monooxygenase [Streptomyces sp. HNM0575]NLU76440.1 lytic polysaccharide monooxygenase [Streptomyces sp. HNM0575]
MSARRTVARMAAVGAVPLALCMASAAPAAAHGSMTDPVSRVSGCFAEGPENPQSAACKAAVKAGGTQALYDWNEVNIPDAAGKHKQIIPDGKLCSAGRTKYKGLDLPRKDWPASKMKAGKHAFSYKATAPHKGTFELYITKSGYDPSKPLKWSDLESKPFAKIKDPQLQGGEYKFSADVPKRSGRHLIYSTWQRSDSPEAFYTCSDVDFGGSQAGAAASGAQTKAAGKAPDAPSDSQIAAGAPKSTVEHHGHGNPSHGQSMHMEHSAQGGHSAHNAPATKSEGQGDRLAQTGGDDTMTTNIALTGAGVLVVGAALVCVAARRRDLGRRGGN